MYVENVKEVTNEVPVQKVVISEKPVEIIRKELIHVPMYTNDPALLKTNPDFSMEEDNQSSKEKSNIELFEGESK